MNIKVNIGRIFSLLESNSTFRQMTINSSWLLFDRILRLITGLFIGVLVIRYLGPVQYGQLSYSLSFVGMLIFLTNLGIDQIVIRDLVHNPEKKNEYLGSALGIRLLGSIIFIVLSNLIIYLVNPDELIVRSIVLILSIGFSFQAVEVIDYWFQSQTSSKYTIIAKDLALILVSIFKIVAVLLGLPLIIFAYIWAAEFFIYAFFLIIIFIYKKNLILKWKFRIKTASNILRHSWPLALSSLMVTLYMKIDQIMLKNMVSDNATGIYAAAVQLSEIWYFIPIVIVPSLFPYLNRLKKQDEDLYQYRIQQMFNILAIFSYSIIIPVSLLAKPVVSLLFGPDYAYSASILSLHIWALLFVSMGVGQGSWNIAENKILISLTRTAAGAIANIILNLLLIPKYYGMGAALSTVIAYSVSGVLMNYFDSNTRRLFKQQLSSIFLMRILK